ncbi:hypothetical protein KQY27_08350 [Methanobrevibacter sp. TMH8]|uniref:hypothetical protein n=1 Tax=Methanobrevibacter sp. TMH8 TaxID=2848611 RepID=UPI001CCCF3EB|nr:hypothetical protein [Methanobrevibacter sp. TMH8]MBZ9571555.1 hypothetical protein [Methanobrevibacter sp. TMH8]
MNPITLPIIITIVVVGIIAIVLVKLFYKDKKASDLSGELPPIVGNHWQESFDKKHDDSDELENYRFVTKSWEEPMSKQQKLNNGVASKVFQEPMHTKHQDIISNEYQKEDKYTDIESGINKNNENSNGSIHFDGFSEDGSIINNDFERNKENNYEYDNYNDNYNNERDLNNIEENTHFEDDGNFTIRKGYPNQRENDYNNSEYITPKKYYSPNDYDNYEDYNQNDNINNENNYNLDNNTNYSDPYNATNDSYNKYDNDLDSFNSKDSSENYNENNSLNNIGGMMNMEEQIIVGGRPQTIKVGDDIIFNFNGESYSSKILEIKHENIRVKYRAQEKWINFSDIRKVL